MENGVPMVIMMDIVVFKWMLRNVLHNAEIHGGDGDIQVRVSTDVAGADVQISVVNQPGSNHSEQLIPFASLDCPSSYSFSWQVPVERCKKSMG